MAEPFAYPRDIRLSYSTNGTFESCLRRFELSRLFQQPRRWEESTASGAGSALHSGLQAYMTHNDPDRAVWEMMRVYPHELSSGWTDDRSVEACIATLELMIERAHNDEFELAEIVRPAYTTSDGDIVAAATVGAVEVPFEIEIVRSGGRSALATGGRLTFVGFIDAVRRSRYTGRFRCTDIKTHRSYQKDRDAVYRYNTQQTPYGIVLEHIQGRGIESFDVNYMDVFVDIVDPRVEDYDYVRTDADISDWFANRLIQIQRLNRAIRSGYFPRTENGCTFYNRPCSHLTVCESRDHDAIQAFLLMGGEAEPIKPFAPWITVQMEVPDSFDVEAGD